MVRGLPGGDRTATRSSLRRVRFADERSEERCLSSRRGVKDFESVGTQGSGRSGLTAGKRQRRSATSATTARRLRRRRATSAMLARGLSAASATTAARGRGLRRGRVAARGLGRGAGGRGRVVAVAARGLGRGAGGRGRVAAVAARGLGRGAGGQGRVAAVAATAARGLGRGARGRGRVAAVAATAARGLGRGARGRGRVAATAARGLGRGARGRGRVAAVAATAARGLGRGARGRGRVSSTAARGLGRGAGGRGLVAAVAARGLGRGAGGRGRVAAVAARGLGRGARGRGRVAATANQSARRRQMSRSPSPSEPEVKRTQLDLQPDEESNPDATDASALLPDALLLEVLSWLRPVDLAAAAPLVCRRWLRLCRRPEAWRRAALLLQDHNEALRLLHRAPALAHLGVNLQGDDHTRMSAVWEELQHTECLVEHLSVVLEPDYSLPRRLAFDEQVTALCGLGPELRGLSATLVGGRPHPQDGEEGEEGEEAGGPGMVLQLIATRMPLLTHLALRLELHPFSTERYGGEMGGDCCPSLSSLVFYFPAERSHTLWRPLLLDLLAARGASLRRLELHASAVERDVPSDVWSAVSRCESLERLSVPAPPSLGLLAGLGSLRDLALAPSTHPVPWLAPASVTALLQRLRRLQLHFPDERDAGSSTMLHSLEALAARCPALQSLVLRGAVPAEALEAACLILELASSSGGGALPALRELELADCVLTSGSGRLLELAVGSAEAGRLKRLVLRRVAMRLQPGLQDALGRAAAALHLLLID